MRFHENFTASTFQPIKKYFSLELKTDTEHDKHLQFEKDCYLNGFLKNISRHL